MPLSWVWCLAVSGALVSRFIGLAADRVFLLWVIIELNLMLFLVVLRQKRTSTKASMVYFLAQRVGRLVLILAVSALSAGGNGQEERLIALSGALKGGLPPFHWWILQVFLGAQKETLRLLRGPQKLLPGQLLFQSRGRRLGLWLALALVVRLVNMIGANSPLKLLSYSSILGFTWGLRAHPRFLVYLRYLFFYWLRLTILLRRIALKTPQGRNPEGGVKTGWGVGVLRLSTLGLAGLPPTSPFFVKLMCLQALGVTEPWLWGLFLIAVPVGVYAYFRFLFKELQTSAQHPRGRQGGELSYGVVRALVLLVLGTHLGLLLSCKRGRLKLKNWGGPKKVLLSN